MLYGKRITKKRFEKEKIRSKAPESKGKEDTRRMLDNYYRSLSYAVWHTPSSQLLPCFLLTIIMTLTDENDVRIFFSLPKISASFFLSFGFYEYGYLFIFILQSLLTFFFLWNRFFPPIIFLCFISKSETVHFSRLQKTRSHHRNHVTWKKKKTRERCHKFIEEWKTIPNENDTDRQKTVPP